MAGRFCTRTQPSPMRTAATVGGHLLPGCEVFAGEVMIRELGDVSLVRMHDEETGLALW